MSLDYLHITVLFYNDIKIVGFEGGVKSFSFKLCQHIFLFPDENYFGVSPMCRLEADKKTITIQLGYGSKIKPNSDLVEIKTDVVRFDIVECNSLYI